MAWSWPTLKKNALPRQLSFSRLLALHPSEIGLSFHSLESKLRQRGQTIEFHSGSARVVLLVGVELDRCPVTGRPTTRISECRVGKAAKNSKELYAVKRPASVWLGLRYGFWQPRPILHPIHTWNYHQFGSHFSTRSLSLESSATLPCGDARPNIICRPLCERAGGGLQIIRPVIAWSTQVFHEACSSAVASWPMALMQYCATRLKSVRCYNGNYHALLSILANREMVQVSITREIVAGASSPTLPVESESIALQLDLVAIWNRSWYSTTFHHTLQPL